VKKLGLHPMQQIVIADDGVIRFRANAAVRALLNAAREGRRCNLNDLAMMELPPEDHMQLAQLIGYSVSGYGDLSYVSKKSLAAADAAQVPLQRVLRKRRK
jgi:hypothetical protein